MINNLPTKLYLWNRWWAEIGLEVVFCQLKLKVIQERISKALISIKLKTLLSFNIIQITNLLKQWHEFYRQAKFIKKRLRSVLIEGKPPKNLYNKDCHFQPWKQKCSQCIQSVKLNGVGRCKISYTQLPVSVTSTSWLYRERQQFRGQ